MLVKYGCERADFPCTFAMSRFEAGRFATLIFLLRIVRNFIQLCVDIMTGVRCLCGPLPFVTL